VIDRALSHKREGMEAVVFSFTIDSASPTKKQGARWIMSDEEKANRLEWLGVDLLVEPPFSLLRGMEPEEFARFLAVTLNAKAVACGYDYRFGKGASADANDLRRLLAPYGVTVETVDAVLDSGEPISSTRIRALLSEGKVVEANRLLGTPFLLDEPVVHGRHLGSKLGFPTANQRFPAGALVPKYGVYATRVTIEGEQYVGVTNVGVKPTVGEDLPGAETYLPEFSGDLYGKQICTEFMTYLRGEEKFPTVEALTAQVLHDAGIARRLWETGFSANLA
jgi:riboflavin kinase/FMN adenylyltransferase